MNYQVRYSNTYLAHHGILGQKWGKRNGPPYPLSSDQMSSSENNYSIKTKNGETLTLVKDKTPKLAKVLGKISKKIDENNRTSFDYSGFVNGKKVTSLSARNKGNGELNIEWADTKNSERGKGYMQATIKLGEQIAKDLGFSKMTAELIGVSPDIHKIVIEKQGWIETGKDVSDDVLDTWGGLTFVYKNL